MGDLAGVAPRPPPRGGPTGAGAAGRGPLGVRLRPRAARRVQLAGAPAGTTAPVGGGLPAARLAGATHWSRSPMSMRQLSR